MAIGLNRPIQSGSWSNNPSLTDGDKGDITVSNSATTWSIDNNAVTNAKLATSPAKSFKANITNGTAVPTDVTESDLTSALPDSADGIIGFDTATNSIVRFPASKLLNVMFSGLTTASSLTIPADSVQLFFITTLSQNLTINVPSGTPTESQQLIIRLKDNGTARTITWNAIFTGSANIPLPTTTIVGQTDYFTFIFNGVTLRWELVNSTQSDALSLTNAQIRASVEGATDSNVFTDADHTKLNGIEASADVTDTANVTSSGALMDSELTDLAGVKGVTISTLQVKPSEGAFANGDKTKLDSIEANATGDQTNAEIRALVESATDSNVFTDADHTKLNGIEASATADQTNAEIRTAVEGATDSNVFTDADHTKLNGIEASATADQTNAEIRTATNSFFVNATSTATLTVNSDVTDIAILTAQAEAITIASPSGSPVQGQKLIIRITDNGTNRAITWNAIFRAVGITLPTTTTASKLLYIGFIYNATGTVKWDAVAVKLEA